MLVDSYYIVCTQCSFVIPSPSTNNAKHNVLLNFNELVHKMRLLITDTLITDTINEEVILTHFAPSDIAKLTKTCCVH
jgi:hypothetical protein